MATKIEWCDETWNPVTGCTPVSAGCLNCYAKRMFGRNLWSYDFTPGTAHPSRMGEPSKWKEHKRIFVCSMGDLFHQGVSSDVFHGIYRTVEAHPDHTFMFLTKRPVNMAHEMEYRPVLPNLWLGVTAENQDAADQRVHVLRQIPAAVRFVSVEPMLGPIEFHKTDLLGLNSLDWVICGAETGPGKRKMEDQWAVDLFTSCNGAGVPFFFKKDSMGNRELQGMGIHEFPEVD